MWMRTRRLALACGLVVALACAAAGCGGDDDGGGGDGGGGGGDGGGGGVDAAAAVVMCAAPNPEFPEFARDCTVPADCEVAFHQYNCCGSRMAIGINKRERSKFTAAETTCVGQYPGCGCAAVATIAQDGKSGPENTIQVNCTAVGSCSTFIP